MSTLNKIKEIELEMSRTQKNKATNSHLGLMKARLAKLKAEVLESTSSKGGPKQEGFEVQKTGDARIGYIGFPSVGKSTLLNKLTNTFSAVAAYEFTTLTCVPGVVNYKGAKLQMLDLPGIIEGAKDGKGRGKQIIAVARTCSCLLIILDVAKPLTHKLIIERELDGFGIRLNQKPANIAIKKKDKGGVNMTSTVKLTHIDAETVATIMKEYKIISADICFYEDATVDQFVDRVEDKCVYIPAIYVMNKIDQISVQELDIIDKIPHNCPVSAHHNWNLDGLLEVIWDHLGLMRAYTKPRGQIPDYGEPVILKTDIQPTVESFCDKLHRKMMSEFKYAWVWGASVKHNPQRVGKEHMLQDEDIIQVVKKI